MHYGRSVTTTVSVMRIRSLAAGAAAGLVLTLTATGAATAEGDDYCQTQDEQPPGVYGFSPQSIPVGISHVSHTFDIDYQDDCPLNNWLIYGNRENLDPMVTDANPTQTFYSDGWKNSDAGESTVTVSATDQAYNTNSAEFPVRLQRATYLTGFNAYPETGTARKSIKGTLKRANWETRKYSTYGGRTLEVQFKPVGGVYEKLGTLRTKRNGTFKTTVVIPESGTLRVIYRGSDISGASKGGGDFTKVS